MIRSAGSTVAQRLMQKLWPKAGANGHNTSAARLHQGMKDFLGYVHRPYPPHPLFPLFLLVQKLPLPADVASIALGQHILAQCLHAIINLLHRSNHFAICQPCMLTNPCAMPTCQTA